MGLLLLHLRWKMLGLLDKTVSGPLQVEEQEKELNAAEASGVHHSTVLKAQERALQERQLELEATRAEMASNVSLASPKPSSASWSTKQDVSAAKRSIRHCEATQLPQKKTSQCSR